MIRFLDRISALLSATGALGFLVAVAVTLLDIFGRLTGVVLVRGAIDIVGLSVVFAGSLAVARSEWGGRNIRIDILSLWIPLRLRPWIDGFWSLCMAGLLALVAWASLSEALIGHGYGERMPALRLSVLTYGVIIAAGFGAGAVVSLCAVLLRRGAAPEPGEGA